MSTIYLHWLVLFSSRNMVHVCIEHVYIERDTCIYIAIEKLIIVCVCVCR